MNYSEISTSTLKEWHVGCVSAYNSDRDPESMARVLKLQLGQYFGVDEFPDWNEHVTKIEEELFARNEAFDPIELR